VCVCRVLISNFSFGCTGLADGAKSSIAGWCAATCPCEACTKLRHLHSMLPLVMMASSVNVSFPISICDNMAQLTIQGGAVLLSIHSIIGGLWYPVELYATVIHLPLILWTLYPSSPPREYFIRFFLSCFSSLYFNVSSCVHCINFASSGLSVICTGFTLLRGYYIPHLTPVISLLFAVEMIHHSFGQFLQWTSNEESGTQIKPLSVIKPRMA
jgi:hypothetical protein